MSWEDAVFYWEGCTKTDFRGEYWGGESGEDKVEWEWGCKNGG